MNWKNLALALILVPFVAQAEPAIKFDCNGSTDKKQECTFAFDKERVEKAFEPVEKQAQSVKSPSEAMDVMAQALTILSLMLKQGN